MNSSSIAREGISGSGDGKSVGSLDNRETVEKTVEPGRHSLRITKGRYASRERSFDAADGDVVAFRCHGTRIWPMYVASIFIPTEAISLQRE
jgi:hypothetical protein